MPVGANINYNRHRILRLIDKIWSRKPRQLHRAGKLCYKNNGAPASSTPADNPNALYDQCVDTINNNLYICTVYDPSGAASTWLKVN